MRLAVLGGVALVGVSAASMPNTSTDIYNYIMRGRVAAAHGENPYYTAADRFPDDAVYPYAGHRYTSEPGGKGPVWMAVNVSLARVAGDDVVDNLLLYRLVLFLFAAGSIGLVAWILRRVEPGHALAGVVIFGWSPLVMVYAPAKTDTLMVFLLLVGTAALVSGRKRRAAVALVLSGLVKLITLPLVGAYWLRELRHRRWREAAWVGGLALATAAAAFLPFSRDPGVMLGLVDAADSAGSDVLALRPLWLAGFVGLVAWVGLTRDRGLPHLLRGWAFIALYFSALLMPIALAWYQMTMIAVVALVRDARIAVAMGALSFASLGLAAWRSAERQASFELPLQLPVPGHVAYLVPLLLLGGVAAFLAFRRARRAPAGTRGTGGSV